MSRNMRRPVETSLLVGLASVALYLFAAAIAARLDLSVGASEYLILHTLLEFASILVSFSIFVVNWESSKQNLNAQSLFVATGFLTVASVDTMYTLSYSGMPDFVTPNGPGKALHYWIFARMWTAVLLWVAAHVRPEDTGWRASRRFLLAGNLLISAIPLVLVTLYEDQLPLLVVGGAEQTPLKFGLEGAVVGVSVAAMVAHFRVYRSTRDEAVLLIVAGLVVSAFGELASALYTNSRDAFSLLGHVYKVAAYYLFFRALLVSCVQRPYVQLRMANERLEQTVLQLDARNRELDALDEVAVTLSSTLKPEAVLEAAVEKVMKVMRAGAGAIFLLEEGTDTLRPVVWRGLKAGIVAECLAHPSRLPFGAAPSREYTQPATALEDRALVRSLGGAFARIAPLRACLCAPVGTKGRLLGSIAMVGQEDRTFSPRDADLLIAIGYQLGLAIENSRLYERTDERLREKLEELKRAERRSSFLSEVGALLGRSMDIRAVLDLVAQKSTEVVGDWCLIYLLDPREKLLRLEAAYHPDEEELAAVRQVLSRRPLQSDEAMLRSTVETGEPLLLNHLSPEKLSEWIQLVAQSIEDIAVLRSATLKSVSAIVAPMRARGRTVGLLAVASSHSPAPLGETELQLVVGLADRAGAAIDNSRLFEESQAQRQHLEAIISQMVDGVVIADETGTISMVNASAQAMLGERIDQLVRASQQSREARGCPAGRSRPSETPLIARALAGELVVGEEITVAQDSGQRVLNVSASPVRGGAGLIDGAVVVLRDVTAERQVDRMKDEFVAVVSHELRTPITAVLGYTDILLRGLRGPLAPKQLEALGSVRTAAHRLLVLINDLLDMSKLEAGRQDLSLGLVDLAAAAERALSSVGVLAVAKGIHLVRAVPPGLPPVLADEEQLHRILGNLLSNALKFTPEGGTVTVSASRVGTEATPDPSLPEGVCQQGVVAVRITDTGIGVATEQKDRIWDKFHQADSSSRRLFGGTGLGLSITRALVELHGGKVWVESQGIPGKGSTFGFTLPIARTED